MAELEPKYALWSFVIPAFSHRYILVVGERIGIFYLQREALV
jgi:hypothetical protein